MSAFESEGATLAALLSETIARQLLFILITVEDELNAYTVFETLNARGLELSATDLLKNYLFSRLRVSADLEALQRRWRSLITQSPRSAFRNSYATTCYASSRKFAANASSNWCVIE